MNCKILYLIFFVIFITLVSILILTIRKQNTNNKKCNEILPSLDGFKECVLEGDAITNGQKACFNINNTYDAKNGILNNVYDEYVTNFPSLPKKYKNFTISVNTETGKDPAATLAFSAFLTKAITNVPEYVKKMKQVKNQIDVSEKVKNRSVNVNFGSKIDKNKKQYCCDS